MQLLWLTLTQTHREHFCITQVRELEKQIGLIRRYRARAGELAEQGGAPASHRMARHRSEQLLWASSNPAAAERGDAERPRSQSDPVTVAEAAAASRAEAHSAGSVRRLRSQQQGTHDGALSARSQSPAQQPPASQIGPEGITGALHQDTNFSHSPDEQQAAAAKRVFSCGPRPGSEGVAAKAMPCADLTDSHADASAQQLSDRTASSDQSTLQLSASEHGQKAACRPQAECSEGSTADLGSAVDSEPSAAVAASCDTHGSIRSPARKPFAYGPNVELTAAVWHDPTNSSDSRGDSNSGMGSNGSASSSPREESSQSTASHEQEAMQQAPAQKSDTASTQATARTKPPAVAKRAHKPFAYGPKVANEPSGGAPAYGIEANGSAASTRSGRATSGAPSMPFAYCPKGVALYLPTSSECCPGCTLSLSASASSKLLWP